MAKVRRRETRPSRPRCGPPDPRGAMTENSTFSKKSGVRARPGTSSDDSSHQGHTRDYEGQHHLEGSRKKTRRPSHSLDADALARRKSPMSWVAPVLRVGHARLPGSLVPLDPMGLSAATPVDLARRRSPAPRSPTHRHRRTARTRSSAARRPDRQVDSAARRLTRELGVGRVEVTSSMTAVTLVLDVE